MEPSIVQIQQLLAAVVLLPLAAAIVNGLVGYRLPRFLVGLFACLAPFFAHVCALRIFFGLRALATADAQYAHITQVTAPMFSWIHVGALSLDVRLMVDPLAALMLLVITGIGFLIHIYSLGYMSDEPAFARYFAYLNLFLVAMLVLVLGDSLPVLFIGWEGVGLMSYLLIGFWYTDTDKASAGRKAFVVNRIGDLGLVCAMLLLMRYGHDLSFAGITQAATSGALSPWLATAITLLLVLGVTGKSAQIPLYVWLPDAMAGPTPVSALIHAATMVTAGIYLMIRTQALLALAPITTTILACIAALSALLAASIATVQTDIKKVLAYSTVSQLGYMLLAVAVGAYSAAMLHVVTHAFFKACLFLGAGSVIHGLHGEQDMRQMGGLKKRMPVTFWTMCISTLAITGMPAFSGFVSKEAILTNVFNAQYATANPLLAVLAPTLWGVGLLTAGLTAFYMWRLFFLTFFSGGTRMPNAASIHESGWSMCVPLCVLAFGALIGGGLAWPELFGGHDCLGQFLGQSTILKTAHAEDLATEWILMAVTTGIAVLGCAIAYFLYAKRMHPLTRQIASGGPWRGVYDALLNKCYIDELYHGLIVVPWRWFSRVVLFEVLERRIFDGVVQGIAWMVRSVGFLGQLFHSGNIQRYLAIFVLALGVLLYGWLTPSASRPEAENSEAHNVDMQQPLPSKGSGAPA